MSQDLSHDTARTTTASAVRQEAADSIATVMVPDSQTSDTTASSTRTRTSDDRSSATDVSHALLEDTQTLDSTSHSIAHQNSVDVKTVDTENVQETRSLVPSIDAAYRAPRVDRSSSPSSHGSGSPGQRSKRMVGGLLKAVSSAVPEVPVAGGAGAGVGANVYRRKGHIDTTGRKISELSLQLKTRLTYAMIKVQNGWENRSIDEVESLAASALSSPMSTTSATMAFSSTHSPRMTTSASSSRARPHDARSSLAASHFPTTSSRPNTAGSGWPRAFPSLQGHAYANQPTRTLAPAPDLRPKARHQQTPSNADSLRATTPTPQEKDAVDTLLFMSSPANSQRFTQKPGVSSPQNSPSRRHFDMPRRALGAGFGPPTSYDRASASSEEEALLSTSSKRGVGLTTADAERRAKRRSYGRLENEMDVDRLLDQMRDVASSEEETDIAMPVAGSNPVVVRM